jgi:hypothetical protein
MTTHSVKELTFVGWHYATNGSQPHLFDPLAVRTSGDPPIIWGTQCHPVGLGHRRLIAYVNLHHDNHIYIYPIKAVISGVGLCAPQEFPENEWTLRSGNISCEYEIVHWG